MSLKLYLFVLRRVCCHEAQAFTKQMSYKSTVGVEKVVLFHDILHNICSATFPIYGHLDGNYENLYLLAVNKHMA